MDFTKIKSDDIRGVLDILKLREGFSRIRDFLDGQNINTKKSWKSIRDEIDTVLKDEGDKIVFLGTFHKFLQEMLLCGQKRVYIISQAQVDPTKLAAPLSGGADLGFFDIGVPDRPETGVSYYYQEWKLDSATIHTFITSRNLVHSEPVSANILKTESQDKYRKLTLIAKQIKPIRVFDHFVTYRNQAYLLIDIPPGVDSRSVDDDAFRYETLIRQQHTSAGPAFVDIFPILKPLYKDDSEGIINYIQFLSNDHAIISARYYHGSMKDYRKQKLQQEGEKHGAQVDPFQLGVKWPSVRGLPAVLLPGDSDMASSASVLSGGSMRRSLDNMVLPGQMYWEGFRHVVSRVLHHLYQVSKAAAEPMGAVTPIIATPPIVPTDAPPSIS